MKKYLDVLKNAAINKNPTFVQLLGMCPTLAVTTSLLNALSMGAAVTVVLICSGTIISLLRRLIPDSVRIASYIVIISAFVTCVQLVIRAWLPAVDAALGIFIPLIVVNCIVLGRAEAFASKNPPLESALDGLGSGLGFTVALSLIGFVREFLGSGTVLGGTPLAVTVPFAKPMLFFVLPAGAFVTLGFVIAAVNALRRAAEKRRFEKEKKL